MGAVRRSFLYELALTHEVNNPFDACMLQGTGHNNPAYGFFGTFEYTNAPGGIVNGITLGLEDEEGIDFNLFYAKTRQDYDWRWAEQWLPHATWYLWQFP